MSIFLKSEKFFKGHPSLAIVLFSSTSSPNLVVNHQPKAMEQLDECCSTQLIDGDGTFNVAGLETFAKAVKLGDCGLSYAVVSIMGPQSSDQLDECCSTQLIDGDGTSDVADLDTFSKAVKLGDCGLSYALVSIMGPQSSEESTLLDDLFLTNFREMMDVFRGRSQTTKSISMAKCADIEPCTLVMDLKGTDGRQREKDDTAFEKKSALFALAASYIGLINMWCHDIGCEQAANKPFLKTVFQLVQLDYQSMLAHLRSKTLDDFKEDIRSITKAVRSASLKLLPCMTVLWLDDDVDRIENTLLLALMDATSSAESSTLFDPLTSSTWEEVPASKTVIIPLESKSLRQSKSETESSVSQAIVVQYVDVIKVTYAAIIQANWDPSKVLYMDASGLRN